jgi:glycosyltransferase involved in cell wall biosynthesis
MAGGVPVTLLLTRHNDESRPDRAEAAQFQALLEQLLDSGGSLNGIPGLDFSRYPQITAAPPVLTPADYFALTRLLVVPSVWAEPFYRVAAEAMINAIPPIVSNRGALPQVVGGDFSAGGGGRVVPVPDWMTFKTLRLPSEQEVEPWHDAVCTLWGRSGALSFDGDPSASDRRRALQRRRLAQAACRLLHLIETGVRPSAEHINA